MRNLPTLAAGAAARRCSGWDGRAESGEAGEDFKKLGIGMIGNSPAEAAKFITSETEKWERVVKAEERKSTS